MQEKNISQKFDPNKASIIILVNVGLACILGVAVNNFKAPQWILPGALLFMTLVGLSVMPEGWLRREEHEGMRVVRWLGVLLATAYPFACWVVIAVFPGRFWPTFIPIALFTVMVTLVGWQTSLIPHQIFIIGFSVTFVLGGVGTILLGTNEWDKGNILRGLMLVSGGVAGIFFAVAIWQNRPPLIWVSVTLYGVALIPVVIILWQEKNTLHIVIGTMLGVSSILGGIAIWRRKIALAVVAAFLIGAALVLMGLDLGQKGNNLNMVAGILFGVSAISIGIALWQEEKLLHESASPLFGVAIIIFGVAAILGGIALWQEERALGGFSLILFGVAIILNQAVEWRSSKQEEKCTSSLGARVWGYMVARQEASEKPPSEAGS